MKLLRSLSMVLVLCACTLPSGCSSDHSLAPMPGRTLDYHKVVTMDFEGRKIAEYIAEGRVKSFEGGYRFWAVQRRIFEPVAMEFHYPLGRQLTAKATNIVITPAIQPAWLARMDNSADGSKETGPSGDSSPGR